MNSIMIGIAIAIVVISAIVRILWLRSKLIAEPQSLPLDLSAIPISNDLFYTPGFLCYNYIDPSVINIYIQPFLNLLTGKYSVNSILSSGDSVKIGNPVAEVKQGEHTLTLRSFCNGTVVETLNGHENIEDENPLFLMCVRLASAPELKRGIEYVKYLEDEIVRIKDFFSFSMLKYSANPTMQIMQDGGTLQKNVLESANQSIWNEFQIEFIDEELNKILKG